jgi:hypothetical protein
MNFDRVHRWSIQNCLAMNPEKLQALLVNPSILLSPIVSPLLLGTNQIAFVNKVKNLGILFNQNLKLPSFAGECFLLSNGFGR